MARARNDFEELERRIGYHFLERKGLERALCHSTSGEGKKGDDNRRLAFLGDAVLELAVREKGHGNVELRERGDLSIDADKFVSDSEVAKRAKLLGLGEWLDMGKGEANNLRGEDRRLADTFEALAGAIYLEARDHAFEVVRRMMSGETRTP
jgi:ribonuclease III